MSIYDFTVKTSQGKEKSLADYKGKVLLIVNTASKCGFTPRFEALQKLYLAYKDKGLEILGFPCNQFAAQDPGSDAEIQQFCRYNYGVTFQIFEKGDVRGETAQPLFQYLTKEKGFEGFDKEHPNAAILEDVLKKNFPEYLEGDGTIGDVLGLDAGGGHVISAMWHGIWSGQIDCDLDRPLKRKTRIVVHEPEAVTA